jgi:hypothetical protein
MGLIIGSLFFNIDQTLEDGRNVLSVCTLGVMYLAFMSGPQVWGCNVWLGAPPGRGAITRDMGARLGWGLCAFWQKLDAGAGEAALVSKKHLRELYVHHACQPSHIGCACVECCW